MDLSALAPFWILFSLASAFFHASRITVTKVLSFDFPARVLTLYVNLASLVVTLPLILWHRDFPLHEPLYLGVLLLGGLLSGCGGWALNAAIKRSEVSLVGPIMTLTPGFVLVLETLLQDASPGLIGSAGLALLMVGSYILSIGGAGTSWDAPLRRLFTNPGSVLTLTAAFCFGAATLLGREGVRMSDPLSFTVAVALINPIILMALFSIQDPGFYRIAFPRSALRYWRGLLLLGLLFALMRIADQIALGLTHASYAMAVKRTAGVFAVILGHMVFREPYLKSKLAGSAVMLAGLFLLTLG